MSVGWFVPRVHSRPPLAPLSPPLPPRPPVVPAPKSSYSLLSLLEGRSWFSVRVHVLRSHSVQRTVQHERTHAGLVGDASFSFVLRVLFLLLALQIFGPNPTFFFISFNFAWHYSAVEKFYSRRLKTPSSFIARVLPVHRALTIYHYHYLLISVSLSSRPYPREKIVLSLDHDFGRFVGKSRKGICKTKKRERGRMSH